MSALGEWIVGAVTRAIWRSNRAAYREMARAAWRSALRLRRLQHATGDASLKAWYSATARVLEAEAMGWSLRANLAARGIAVQP